MIWLNEEMRGYSSHSKLFRALEVLFCRKYSDENCTEVFLKLDTWMSIVSIKP